MRLHKGFLFLLMICHIPAVASHIVGGEFELLYIRANTYRINMILYFDVNNGNPEATDLSADIYIYSKRNQQFIQRFTLPLVLPRERVKYTKPACSSGEVVTDKLTYTSVVTLSSSMYNDPEGYYMVWQRCCRNYSILNIYSEEPPTDEYGNVIDPNAKYAGQTFYLEFPAIVQNGQPFVNSSPRLFPPLNDFACPNKPYYADFSGTDDDGDSLVYSLATPLNTLSGNSKPRASPGPYPDVQWRPGYSLSRVTGGTPDLRISRDGILRVTPPGVQGLFAFAVKVEEFRNRVKIGETRRDFQLLVTDRCSDSSPPIIQGKKLSEANFSHGNTMELTFDANTPDADRCINIRITDPDSERAIDQYTENIRLVVKALNFSGDGLNSIRPPSDSYVLRNGSAATFNICFPKCPFVKTGAAQIAIVAYDDACAVPLTDTLKVNVTVTPPANSPARFTQPTANPLEQNIREGDTFTVSVEATDEDNDNITLTALPAAGYSFSDFGMRFTPVENRPGLVRGTFTLYADCHNYNFADKNSFLVLLSADDNDVCKLNPPAKATMNLNVLLAQKELPTIESDLTPDAQAHRVEVSRKVGEPLSFTVIGREPSNVAPLSLQGQGIGFNFAAYQMTFPPASSISPVSSVFKWTPTCEHLKAKDKYQLQFIVNDQTNKCTVRNADILLVDVNLLPPENTAPKLHFDNTDQIPFNRGAFELNNGTKINFTIRGTDEDIDPQDELQLAMTAAAGNPMPKNYIFKPVVGKGTAASPFTWQTNCSIFKNHETSNLFAFVFKVTDNRCANPLDASDTLKIRVLDPVDEGEFTPPNVITPDGDGCNDFFAVENIPEAICGVRLLKINFPKDNCAHAFEYIKIFNRYGKEVFISANRNFRWFANDAPAGVYYYDIKFSDKTFKGLVNVVR